MSAGLKTLLLRTAFMLGQVSFVSSFLVFLPRVATTNSKRLFAHSSSSSSSKLRMALNGQILVPVETCIKLHGEEANGVVFVDGSWYLSKDRSGREEFEKGPRIPNARFFDIDQIASTGDDLNPKGLPHMMPPKKLFAAAMDAMKITNEDHLIVYAAKDCPFVHRSWFQLRAMGHDGDRVHLMDGTLYDWQQQGGPLEEGPVKALVTEDLDLTKETKYVATDAQNIVDMEEVKAIVASQGEDDTIIVDARPSARFLGEVDEPRPGLRSGHMPGAKNLPFMELLDPDNLGRFKPRDELEKIIKDAGLDVLTDKKIVTTCGSGVTACAITAALEVCGRKPGETSTYDGSWIEWGGSKDTAVVK